MIEFEINTNKKQIDFEVTQGIPKYVPANFQSKNITITENGTTEVLADHGYDGLAKVSVEVNVQGYVPTTLLFALTDGGEGDNPVELTDDFFPTNKIRGFFMYNKNIIKINASKITEITTSQAFNSCSNLREVQLPNLVRGNSSMFKSTPLIKADFPEMVRMGSGSEFQYCSYLEEINMPKLLSIGNSSFQYCGSLKKAIFSSLTYIGAYAFQSTGNSTTIFDFRGATVIPNLSSYTCFQGANFKHIVVPDELYDEWIVATNWVSYANKIIKASEYTEA